MNPAQLASWQRRLDCCLADPRPCHEALQLLFAEMARALVNAEESLERWMRCAESLETKMKTIDRQLKAACIEGERDLRLLAQYEDFLADSSLATLPPEGLAALLRRKRR